ncbi:MAG TPA: sigma 54-interacting transcriptional regulator [Candidatus Binatia bacterium]|nr:sigma 54-interacting transcriptional regulator [Candidatus Binatia bacterium]
MSLRPGAKADDAGTRPPEPKKQAPNSDINRNEHYRDLVEHSRDLLCTHDLQGRLLSINPAPARLLGYSVEELMAIPMRELVAPEFRDRFESYLRHIASAGQAHGRVAILTRTGDTLIWEYNNTLRTEGVHSPVVRGMAHDITEQVRAEMAAQRSAEQVLKKVRESERVIGELRLFRTLVDHSSDAIEVVDPDTMRFLDLNEKAFSGLGYTREELLGMSVFDINPVATPKSVAAVRQQIEEHGFVLLETTHQRKDGSTFPVEISIRKVSLERDYLVSVVRDLSERQESEARLKASERRYHALHHSSPVGVCWVETATGRFLGVNTKFCEITGRSERELLQSDFRSITHPDDVAVSARKVESLVEGAREYRLEKRYVRPDGSVRWVSLSVVAMWQEGEKPDWHMAIVQDVTDHRLTEEARAQAEQELRRTVEQLQTVSEELRQAKEKLAEEKLYLEEAIDTELGFGEIIGRSDAMKEVMAKVAKVAPSDATVLLLGETGTGKELVARALHRMSGRKNNSFIKMNCAAIPSGLLESELFGHERGAFTGAVASKLGRLELADKGTLFLDEIGEIPLNLQPKLLRVLQDMEFERLGGTQTLRVDFRLLAATNRELLQSVKAYEFRSDLFYRLNVFPIHIPPLRERRQDIRPLVEHFVRHFAVRMKKSISSVPSKTMEMLVRWEWPGNIRELENFIERSVILTPGSVLQCPDLEKTAQEGEPVEIRQLSLRERERERITQVLRECRGRLGGPEGAAARLGLKRTTLQSKLDQMGIKPSAYRSQLTGSQ